jgi:hypothetical protein
MKKIIITKSGMAINTDYIVEMHIIDHHSSVVASNKKERKTDYAIYTTLSKDVHFKDKQINQLPLFSKVTTAEEIQTTYDEIIKFLVNDEVTSSSVLDLREKE